MIHQKLQNSKVDSDLQTKLPAQGLILTSELAWVEWRKRDAHDEERKVAEAKEELEIPCTAALASPVRMVSSSGNVGYASGS